MLSNNRRSDEIVSGHNPQDVDSSDEDYDIDDFRLASKNHLCLSDNYNISDLETSGVFVAGYKEPIHKWEHPGYQFLTEPNKASPKTERLFKVIVVGDATVGKTSFVQRYVNDVFRCDYKGTVGVDFAMKIIHTSEKEVIKLQLWDIAGQERFTWMTRVYYRDAQGCIVLFDLSNRTTLFNALKWKNDVDSKCQLSDGSPIPCFLIGNKHDLPIRAVTQEEIEHAYLCGNYIGWTEVSAKDGSMIEDCMKFLVDSMLLQDGQKTGRNDFFSDRDHENIDITKTQKKKPCCNF